jgi:hypothetical protein
MNFNSLNLIYQRLPRGGVFLGYRLPSKWGIFRLSKLAVYVLVEYIKHPQASVGELSKAVKKKKVKASSAAITRLFKEHDLKKTPI